MYAVASALVSIMKAVISFARLQHLFDVAATSVDVYSNFLSYPARLSL